MGREVLGFDADSVRRIRRAVHLAEGEPVYTARRQKRYPVIRRQSGPVLYAPLDVDLSASQNNYALQPKTPWLRFNCTAPGLSITGFANGYRGLIVQVSNVGTDPFTVPCLSGSSAAGNRVQTPNGRDLLIQPWESYLLKFLDTASPTVWLIGELPITINQWGIVPPSHTAPLTTVYFDSAAKNLYVNNDGTNNWTIVTGGGGGITFGFLNKTANYGILSGDSGKLISWDTTSGNLVGALPDPATLTTAWAINVQNRGPNRLNLTPAAGSIDGDATLVAEPGEGFWIFTNATDEYFTQRGKTPGSIRVVGNTATDTILPSDHNGLVSYQGNVDCAVTHPQMPKGFRVDLENIGTDKYVSVTDASAQRFSVPYARGLTLFSDGTTAVGGQPGNVTFGLLTATADTDIVPNHIGRMVCFEGTEPLVATMTDETLGAGFGVELVNFSTDIVTIEPETPGNVLDGGPAIVLFPREGIKLNANGTSFSSDRGKFFISARIITDATYTITIADNGFLLIFEPTTGVDPEVELPTMPDGFQVRVTCLTRGSFVRVTDEDEQEILVGWGRGTHLVSNGDDAITGNPGQTLSGHDTYDDDTTITWYHSGRGAVLDDADPHTFTLDPSTFNAFFGCKFRCKGEGALTIAAPVIDEEQKLINDEESITIQQCQSVDVTCDGGAYEIYPGFPCDPDTGEPVSGYTGDENVIVEAECEDGSFSSDLKVFHFKRGLYTGKSDP